MIFQKYPSDKFHWSESKSTDEPGLLHSGRLFVTLSVMNHELPAAEPVNPATKAQS